MQLAARDPAQHRRTVFVNFKSTVLIYMLLTVLKEDPSLKQGIESVDMRLTNILEHVKVNPQTRKVNPHAITKPSFTVDTASLHPTTPLASFEQSQLSPSQPAR
jgi:hypothetical protein